MTRTIPSRCRREARIHILQDVEELKNMFPVPELNYLKKSSRPDSFLATIVRSFLLRQHCKLQNVTSQLRAIFVQLTEQADTHDTPRNGSDLGCVPRLVGHHLRVITWGGALPSSSLHAIVHRQS